MTIAFYVLVGLAIFHFIWDGILAPSLRFEIRYKLFKLRDDLRRLKIEHGDQFSDDIFDQLQKTINNQIGLLHHGNISNLYRAYKKFGNDEGLVVEMMKLDKLIEACQVEEVGKIRDKSVGWGMLGFLVNSGGWAVYIVPPVFIALSYGTIRVFMKKLIGLPEKDIDRILPPSQNLHLSPRH
jgi:hypothetical protein